MTLMLVLNLFALALGADAVAFKECCVPDQYSARFDQTLVINYGAARSRLCMKGDENMDYTGHRYAFNLMWYDYDEKKSGKSRYLYLYNEGTFYVIVDDKRCQKGRLVTPEPSQCLPNDAHFEGTAFLGEGSLQLNTWRMQVEEQGVLVESRFSTTQEHCIPVVSSFVGKGRETDNIVADSVSYNYTAGCDPSSFIVPDICHNATLQLKGAHVGGLFDGWNRLRKGMGFF